MDTYISPSPIPVSTHARTHARTHTHTDEFICFIASEKERLAREKEAELEKLRISGCLDPLTKTLIAFDDTEDLHLKIDGIYRRLDNDDSGGLNFEEFRQGLKHMTIKDRHSEGHIALDIHLTRDDFDTVTEHGVFLGSKGEFNKLQFRNMMRGELERYVRRCIANCLRTSDSEEYRSTVMLIKMMEISLDNSFLEIRQVRPVTRMRTIVHSCVSACIHPKKLMSHSNATGT